MLEMSQNTPRSAFEIAGAPNFEVAFDLIKEGRHIYVDEFISILIYFREQQIINNNDDLEEMRQKHESLDRADQIIEAPRIIDHLLNQFICKLKSERRDLKKILIEYKAEEDNDIRSRNGAYCCTTSSAVNCICCSLVSIVLFALAALNKNNKNNPSGVQESISGSIDDDSSSSSMQPEQQNDFQISIKTAILPLLLTALSFGLFIGSAYQKKKLSDKVTETQSKIENIQEKISVIEYPISKIGPYLTARNRLRNFKEPIISSMMSFYLLNKQEQMKGQVDVVRIIFSYLNNDINYNKFMKVRSQ